MAGGFSKGLSLACFMVTQACFGETITFVADAWPPFNGEPNSEQEGYMMDVARAIFEPKGYTVVYKNLPWNRSIQESRKGRFNAIIGASRNDAPDFIFPDEELGRNRLSFYTKADSTWRFEGVPSLKKVYLGVIDGYDYREWFKKYEKDYRDRIYVRFGDEPLKKNIQSLVYGRLDAVVDNETAIRWVAKQQGLLDKIRDAGEDQIGGVSYIYHAFSPNLDNSKKYSEVLSQGIIELRVSGELQRILDKYGLEDWQKK